MSRRFRNALLASSIALVLTACSGGADEGETTERLADQLVETAGITAEQADCVAEALVDDLGEDEVKDIELTSDEPDEDFAEELAAATRSASTKCDIDLGSVGN